MWESLCWWDPEGCARSCQLCRRFKEPMEKGKWRAEDEGEDAGPSKRPRVGLLLEQMELGDPQVGS